MQAIEFVLQNWSPRDSAQVALKFGLLVAPIALWLRVAAPRRRPERLVVAFGAATGALFLVFAYIQITRGEVTAALAPTFRAVIEEGRVVSVCASVRITGAAHTAGVETLPAFRRRGHAADVVAGWADAVRRLGAVPLYSTSWDNTASRNVAAHLGMSQFGADFHVT